MSSDLAAVAVRSLLSGLLPRARMADALRRLAASRAGEPANLGALPLCGLRGLDEHGAYVSWLPERGATTQSRAEHEEVLAR